MTEPFSIEIQVRDYELDTQGHVSGAVYYQYAAHAKWQWLHRAGVSIDALLDNGLGPVTLESTIRYHRELRGGDTVHITCTVGWGQGKTFQIKQEFTGHGETLSAEITSREGLLDLTSRRLVDNPDERCRAIAANPQILGL